ncbi:MAG: response regulator, partial [Stenotrophomonas sp.]
MPVRVLIVDDHTLVRAGLSRLLQGFANVEVVADASNAEQALQMAIQHSPDVILMDINLPGMNGNQAQRILRNDTRTAHIPVIALTANAM